MKKTILLALLVLMGVGLANAQTRVTGKVTSADDGSPLPFVTVTVKGYTAVATTGNDGSYALDVPAGGETLVFSFVGMEQEEVTIGGRSVIDAALSADATTLQEVVVTGVGTATDRRKVAIAVESVKGLDKVVAPSLDAALSGKVAGAQFQQISGQPGQQANIILRGINTVSSTQPMILVDGVQISTTSVATASYGSMSSRFADLDISDIERVEVVQGAAAATIYGAQGANGVIQIFTKRGRVGDKTRVTYNGRISFDSSLKGKLETVNHHYYATDSEGYITAGSTTNRISVDPTTGYWTLPTTTTDGTTVNNKPYKERTYDHLDQLLKNSMTYNNSINIAGASGKSDYSISLSNTYQEGTMRGDYKRTNLSINVGTEIIKNLKIRSTTRIVTSSNSTGGVFGENSIYSGLGFALKTHPFVDLKYKNDRGHYAVTYDSGDNSINPFYTNQFKENTDKVFRVIQGFDVSYNVAKFLELNYKYGIDESRAKYSEYVKNQSITATPTKGLPNLRGTLFQQDFSETVQNSLVSAFVRLDFQKDFNLNLPLQSTTQFAYDWRERKYNQLQYTATGLPTEPPINMGTGEAYANDQYQLEFVTFGYLINQKFDYKNLFGVSGGFRADYSSAFGKGSDPFYFPRGDVYFRFSEVIKNPVIQELKLRAAYGEAGIQPGPYDRFITLGSDNRGGKNLFFMNQISRNPGLDVEVSKEFEVGLDYAINTGMKSWLTRITGAATYWNRTTDGAIRQVDVAPSTGALSIITNSLDLESHGVQISIDADVFTTKNFDWQFGARFGLQRSKVKTISNHLPIIVGSGGSGQTVLKEGDPIGAFYGYSPVSSLDQKDSQGNYYINQSKLSDYEVVNGMVVEIASKRVQMTSEQGKIGDATPDFNISFFNTFSLYGVNISVQLDWVKGAQAYNQTRQFMYRDRVHGDYDKAITIGGQTGAWVQYYYSLYNTNNITSYFVEDASYWRLKDLTVSYDFNKLAKLSFFQSLTISLTGRNLFTITDYLGMDPESVGTRLNNPLYRGIDLYNYPNSRSFVVGLNVVF